MSVPEPCCHSAESPSRLLLLARAALERPWAYVAMSGAILLLDMVTGPYLMFPVLFVIPVTFAAWLCSERLAHALAVLLPVGRFMISVYWEHVLPESFAALNALIRIGVLVFIAYLVARTARQTRELRREVKLLEGFLPICSYCKKIRNDRGDWEPMEGYISARSEAEFSHGICPECMRQHHGEWVRSGPRAATASK